MGLQNSVQLTDSSIKKHPDYDQHQMVAYREDKATGLRAFIAIHNQNLGPALGGCRMYPYSHKNNALTDVLRLSKGMTYKSAIAGLPLGGGKAVIMGNPRRDKSKELLLAMGNFINSIQGSYISAEDSGTSVADLAIMGETTQWVSGIHSAHEFHGDPSPYTAMGTFEGIKAAVKHQLQHSDLAGISVAVQGVGNVGMHLTKLLTQAGARVYVADVNEDNLAIAKERFAATVVDKNKIHRLDVDVFAPCAMGGAINNTSIQEIRASIIAGAANNQLSKPDMAETARQLGILYAPDYVINAGGIIDIHHQQLGKRNVEQVRKEVTAIGATLTSIFHRAKSTEMPTSVIADKMAEERFLARRQQTSIA